MHLAQADADLFTTHYQRVLHAALALSGDAPEAARRGNPLMALILGRQWLFDPQGHDRLAPTLQQVEQTGGPLPPDLLHALGTMQFGSWIYLKDLTYHAVFLDGKAQKALAVKGLNSPISAIVGDTRALIQTGVCAFQGQYLCDGLISQCIWLGSHLVREYSDRYRHLKKSGHFLTCPADADPAPTPTRPKRPKRGRPRQRQP